MLVDFDGTISLIDTTDLLLDRFADPAWRSVEAAWERGEIGSRDCMARQIDLVRASPDDVDALYATVPLDPGFVDFVRLCERHGVPVAVVSDGLDRSIRTALARLGLDLPVFANALEPVGDRRWELSFPHADRHCGAGAGHCKCATQRASAGTLAVLIGDGRSDFCAAAEADMVFAKGRLAAHCRAAGIPHVPFGTFDDLTPSLAARLADLLAAVPALALEQDRCHAV